MTEDSYIHAALPGSPGGPLLLLFHGTGGDEHQFVGLGQELVPGAAIVAPRCYWCFQVLESNRPIAGGGKLACG